MNPETQLRSFGTPRKATCFDHPKKLQRSRGHKPSEGHIEQSQSFLLRWHRQIQNSFGYMDKILHNGRCLLPNWHIGHHVNLTCYRLWSSIATAKQVLHVFDHHHLPQTMSEAAWAQEVGQNPQEVLSLHHFLPPHYHFHHQVQFSEFTSVWTRFQY